MAQEQVLQTVGKRKGGVGGVQGHARFWGELGITESHVGRVLSATSTTMGQDVSARLPVMSTMVHWNS